jgi:ATP-dependent Clp endopeptidase proteolytic subunit ClpP
MKKYRFAAALVARAQKALARPTVMNFLPKPALAAGDERSWYRINRAAAASEVDILIYSEIGWWGVTAQDFVSDLAEVDAERINLHLNSPGGSVFDGIAIYQALVQHKAEVIVHIDGWAASIASVIAMAGDTIKIGEAAQIMIHQPWSWVMGTAGDMRKEADVLDSIEGAIIDVYVARSGGDRDEIAGWVGEETWFKGQDAVDAGFADEVVPLKLKKPNEADDRAALAASLPAAFFASIFPHLPEEVSAALAEEVPEQADDFDFANGTDREFEKFLRRHGASGQRAHAIANKGFKAAKEPPGGATPPDQPDNSDRPGVAVKRAAAVAAIRLAAQTYPTI